MTSTNISESLVVVPNNHTNKQSPWTLTLNFPRQL